MMNKTVFKKYKIEEEPSDFAYWQTRPYTERLATLEAIREEYIRWRYDPQPRFQRVYRIVKQE